MQSRYYDDYAQRVGARGDAAVKAVSLEVTNNAHHSEAVRVRLYLRVTLLTLAPWLEHALVSGVRVYLFSLRNSTSNDFTALHGSTWFVYHVK